MKRWFLRVIAASLLLSAVLTSLCMLANRRSIQAASTSRDPFVVVAHDMTNENGVCREAFHINVSKHGSHAALPNNVHPTVTEINCPVGTIIGSKVERRSEAVSKHESFVTIPDGGMTPMTVIQVQQMLTGAGNRLRAGTGGQSIHPLTACGASSYASIIWRPASDTELYGEIDYFKTSDCRYVALDTSWIDVHWTSSRYWEWLKDMYAGNAWYISGNGRQVDLLSGWYNAGINSNQTPGYYYENWVETTGCGSNPCFAHNDMGPLN